MAKNDEKKSVRCSFCGKHQEQVNRILSENTGKPLDVVTADCERDNFMSAEEAVEYGLIDKVIDKR